MYVNGRGFFSTSIQGMREEMIALACESKRSYTPVYHYILSWREGEQPTVEQLEEAVDIMLTEFGMREHQAIYSLHGDTDNIHAHILINRVDPEKQKIVDINGRFDLEAAHRALARIELTQGWSREPNGRYFETETGELAREYKIERLKPCAKALDHEKRQGSPSAERIGIEKARPILLNEKSWDGLHKELGAIGIRFEKKGSGGILIIGERVIKASSCGKECSLKSLEKRLGEFQPSKINPTKKVEEIIELNPEAKEYQKEKERISKKKRFIKEKHEKEKKELEEKHRKEREALKRYSWKGKGRILNSLRKELAQRQKSEKKHLQEIQREERNKVRALPDFETWLRQQGMNKAANQTRFNHPIVKVPPTQISKNSVASKEKLVSFEKYHSAVQADRYRITSRNEKKNLTLILDRDPVTKETKGFLPNDVKKHLPDMERLEKKGENIYITPISENTHHILIDDLSREKLKQLILDGYEPAVVLESSPNNYQAIINLPKLGSKHDKQISNKITQYLNTQYGDEKLRGAIHPHRFPGFSNRKEKHKKSDGTFPIVKLLETAQRICEKTLNLSKKILIELENFSTKRKEDKAIISEPQTFAGNAYLSHLQDIRSRMPITDFSRLDSMIALRLRATGHNQIEIENAILNFAPKIRKKEGRNWQDYARRTAAYAFSPAGDRDLDKLAKYIKHWKTIENKYQTTTEIKT